MLPKVRKSAVTFAEILRQTVASVNASLIEKGTWRGFRPLHNVIKLFWTVIYRLA